MNSMLQELYSKNYLKNPIARSESVNFMNIEGKGVVRAVPNIVIATIGVLEEDVNLEAALSASAQKTSAVISAIKNLGVDERDIQTSAFNVEPRYDYMNGQRIFRGFAVSNILKITVREVNNLGEIIDTSVRSGANIVRDINFAVENVSDYYNEALRLAIADSRRKAQAVATEVNVALNEIPIFIQEERDLPVSIRSVQLQALDSVTPILPGELEITSNIKVTYSYKY
jgi:uncharacterized protein